MAAYQKFNQFTKDLIDGVHDFDAHTFKVALSNVAPVPGNAVKADIAELAAGNGYVAGGPPTTVTTSAAAGVAKAIGTDIVITASGGSIGPFRYAILYNDTPSSPLKPLIGFWDYGSAITLLDGEPITVDFNATHGIFQVA